MYPNVIVRFFDRNKVYECLKKSKELSKLKDYKLFMTENLCENYKSIFDSCKRLWTTVEVVNFTTMKRK